MGAYESFFLKDPTLEPNQIKALKSCGIKFTTSEKVFRGKCDDDESTILIVKMVSFDWVWVADCYITATNVSWKYEFRNTLRKNKIRFTSRTF